MNICIGTWNVLNVLQPGKIQELAEQIANTQLTIVAVQEKRCSGNGLIIGIIILYTTLGLIDRPDWYWLYSYEESIEACFRI
jgi:hypothetical protein